MDLSLNRNMIFISHAWEDFEFTKWLALKLANEGYGVWCDLTKLLGGENWPQEINNALQNRTCKFLFVLSKSSNTRPDPLGELETARKVMKREYIKDFIIPLKIDDISRDEVDYRLQEIQTISFDSSKWANGLADLLEKLDSEKLPRHSSFNPNAVNDWWKKYGTNSSRLLDVSESLESNRFRVVDYPKTLYVHCFEEKPKLKGYIKYPVVSYNNHLLSFASADNIQNENGILSRIIDTIPLAIKDVLIGEDEIIKNSTNGTYYFTRLLNQSFEKGIVNKNLKTYKLSKSLCYFFDKELLENGRIIFRNNNELDSRIKLWGKFKNESWHWGIQANIMAEPDLHYLIQPHIIVGINGGYKSAPKGAYKSWRNDKWRDRLKASMYHLSEDKDVITIDVGSLDALKVSSESIRFNSPVSYEEPMEQVESEEVDIDE